MVHVFSNQEAAERFGVTRQAVWKTVQRMREALIRYKEARVIEDGWIERTLPRGWRRATITVLQPLLSGQADAEAAHKACMNQVWPRPRR